MSGCATLYPSFNLSSSFSLVGRARPARFYFSSFSFLRAFPAASSRWYRLFLVRLFSAPLAKERLRLACPARSSGCHGSALILVFFAKLSFFQKKAVFSICGRRPPLSLLYPPCEKGAASPAFLFISLFSSQPSSLRASPILPTPSSMFSMDTAKDSLRKLSSPKATPGTSATPTPSRR